MSDYMQQAAMQHGKFAAEKLENELQSLVNAGYEKENLSLRYRENCTDIFYKDDVIRTLKTESRIQENEGRFDFVTTCEITGIEIEEKA